MANLRNSASGEIPVSECETCSDLADKAFEASRPSVVGEIASEFLAHMVHAHTSELMTLLAEKYVPIFMKKRSLR